MPIVQVDISRGEVRKLRPPGESILLGPYVREISSILGIEPSLYTDQDFIKMANELVIEKTTTCLLESDSDVYVDLKVCRWCPRSRGCQMNSLSGGVKALRFHIGEHPEGESIEKFLEDNGFISNMFPSKDPFQIGWSSKGTREVFVEPMNERIIHPSEGGIDPWGGLYYCPALRRHLSLFEAQLIERLHEVIDVGGFSKGVLSREDDALVGSEYIEWISKETISIESITKFWQSLEEGGYLDRIKNLIQFTSANHSSGLYGVGTEISFHGEMSEDEGWDHAIQFLYDIAINLKGNEFEEEMMETRLVQPRLEVILLIPESVETIDIQERGFRIMRTLRVRGISSPWLLIDEDLERYPAFSIPVSHSNLSRQIIIPLSDESLEHTPLGEFFNNRISAHLIDYNNFGNHHSTPDISPDDLFSCSACSIYDNMNVSKEQVIEHFRKNHPFFISIPTSQWASLNAIHQKFRDRVSAGHGPEFHKIWHDFKRFLEYHGIFAKNRNLRSAFSDPVIRKLTPAEAIIQLQSEDRLDPISYTMGELDLEDIQKESFMMPVKSGMLIISRNLHRGKEKYQDIYSASPYFIEANGGLGNKFTLPLLESFNWKHSVSGDKVNIEEHLADIDSCLGAIWCSEGVKVFLSPNQPECRTLSGRILRMIHSSGSKRVTCFSTASELLNSRFSPFQSADHDTIRGTYIGHVEGLNREGWHFFDDCPICNSFDYLPPEILDDTIISWQPAMAASEFSPQFVFLGGMGG